MKKLHLINNLVLFLLILGAILCFIICNKFNLSEGALVGVQYLGGLMLFFGLFWIVMKWGNFTIKN